jgi:hypothetical protein
MEALEGDLVAFWRVVLGAAKLPPEGPWSVCSDARNTPDRRARG